MTEHEAMTESVLSRMTCRSLAYEPSVKLKVAGVKEQGSPDSILRITHNPVCAPGSLLTQLSSSPGKQRQEGLAATTPREKH